MSLKAIMARPKIKVLPLISLSADIKFHSVHVMFGKKKLLGCYMKVFWGIKRNFELWGLKQTN